MSESGPRARIAFAGDHLTASFNAQSFGGRAESGLPRADRNRRAHALCGPAGAEFRTPAYSESDLCGSGFGLTYNGRDATDARSESGARWDRQMLLNPAAVLALRAKLAWAHDSISDPTLLPFRALPGASFIVQGATPAKNSALTSAGAELRLASGVSMLGKFDSEFAGHSQTYAGTGTVRYTW